MVAKALVSVLALLVGIGILLSALEWMAPGHAPEFRASGSRPVEILPYPVVSWVVP